MSIQLTRDNFSTDEEYAEYTQRMQEMAASELRFNIQKLQDIRTDDPLNSPCKLFYQFNKGIPLSVFLKVYPFNELVDCGSNFQLEELTELKRLYSTFDEDHQQRYTDSFHNLEQIIFEKKYPPAIFSSEPSTSATPIPAAYSTQPKRSYKGFQSSNERVEANKEVQNIIHNPEPSQSEISRIQYENYMQTRNPLLQEQQQQQQPSSMLSRVKGFFGFGGRKTSKKISRRQQRSKSRSRSRSRSNSKNLRSKSQSKKFRSYSRSKK